MAGAVVSEFDGVTNSLLATMYDEVREGDLSTHVEFLPGLFLHADPAMGLSGRYRSPQGQLLELDAKMATAGKWTGLHLRLPSFDRRQYSAAGFIAKVSAPGPAATVAVCLRSGIENGFVDCFFEKKVSFAPEESSHVDILAFDKQDRIPDEAPWREFILFLPTKDFRLTLSALRVFLI
jgi:hypothetical protein